MSKTKPVLRSLPDRQRKTRAGAPDALGSFPQVRPRRNRGDAWTRRLTAENHLTADDLILPIFVQGQSGTTDVPSLPGIARHGLDCLVDEVGAATDLGIPAIAVFPFMEEERKTPDCEEAYNPNNLVCRAVRILRDAFPDLGLITDVALDPFNSLGHDGLVRDGKILNDETLDILCRQAVVQAEAGSDTVGPSDMMDGRVGAIRSALDNADLQDVRILAYSAKYASAFYGPFRDAVGSGGALTGDKSTYQMDPANRSEALREAALDLQEGADMVMVKPGLPYLDVLRDVKEAFGVPTLAYQVSGEYAMMKAAAANGWLDNDKILLETLLAFKRAGADAVLTYAAPEVARLIKG